MINIRRDHDKDRGNKIKIDEPKTPYNNEPMLVEEESESSSDDDKPDDV